MWGKKRAAKRLARLKKDRAEWEKELDRREKAKLEGFKDWTIRVETTEDVHSYGGGTYEIIVDTALVKENLVIKYVPLDAVNTRDRITEVGYPLKRVLRWKEGNSPQKVNYPRLFDGISFY